MNHPNREHIKDWGPYLRRFRKRHGLTQAALAELLTAGQPKPVRESTVQRWEYGERTPPPYLKLALERIAERIKLRDSTSGSTSDDAKLSGTRIQSGRAI